MRHQFKEAGSRLRSSRSALRALLPLKGRTTDLHQMAEDLADFLHFNDHCKDPHRGEQRGQIKRLSLSAPRTAAALEIDFVYSRGGMTGNCTAGYGQYKPKKRMRLTPCGGINPAPGRAR